MNVDNVRPEDLRVSLENLTDDAAANGEIGAKLAFRLHQAEKDLVQAKFNYEITLGEYGEGVKAREPKTSESAIERTRLLDPNVSAAYVAYKEAECDRNLWQNLFTVALQRKSSIETLRLLTTQGA